LNYYFLAFIFSAFFQAANATEVQLSDCETERLNKSIRKALGKAPSLHDPKQFHDKEIIEPKNNVSAIVEASEIYIQKLDGIHRKNYYLSGAYFDFTSGEWLLNYDCVPVGNVSSFDCGFRVLGSNEENVLFSYELYP